MRILHALGNLGRLVHNPEQHALAGIGKAAINIASAQSNIGHFVVTCGFSDPFPTGREKWKGVEIHTMRQWKWARIPPRFDASFLLPTFIQSIRYLPFDVIHTTDTGLLHLGFTKVKVVHIQIPFGTHIGKSDIWKKADGVVCVSKYVRDEFLKVCNYPEDKLFIVHNGASANNTTENEAESIRKKYGLENNEIMILFVGALVQQKGLHVLLKSIQDLKNLQRDYSKKIKVVVVGGSHLWRMRGESSGADKYESDMLALGKKLGVNFAGLLPDKEVKSYYKACDILVIPSVFQDPHPLVSCEAMAAGKPVIASCAGGIPDSIIDGETGILFSLGKYKELTSAICRLVDDVILQKKMGAAAKLRSKQFSWNVAAKDLDMIYQTLLENKN